MAEEDEGGAAESVTGFERYATETLLTVYQNQLAGLGQIYDHWQKGTVDVRRKDGAATPREFGGVLQMLHDKVKAELIKRGELESE